MMSAMSPRCTANRRENCQVGHPRAEQARPNRIQRSFFPFVRNMIWASCNLLHEMLRCCSVQLSHLQEAQNNIYLHLFTGKWHLDHSSVCLCVFDSEFLRHWCSWYFTHLKANKCHHHYGEHFVAHRHHQNGILWQRAACRGAISLNPF